jgi:hypothetical protein
VVAVLGSIAADLAIAVEEARRSLHWDVRRLAVVAGVRSDMRWTVAATQGGTALEAPGRCRWDESSLLLPC